MDELHPKLISALTINDAAAVQNLVVEQCKLAALLQGRELSDIQRERLRHIREHVVEEQAMIAQAVKVSEYFLAQFHKQSILVEFG